MKSHFCPYVLFLRYTYYVWILHCSSSSEDQIVSCQIDNRAGAEAAPGKVVAKAASGEDEELAGAKPVVEVRRRHSPPVCTGI